MNFPINKKLSTSNPGINLKKTDRKQPTWHFEVEGSGQRTVSYTHLTLPTTPYV